MVKGAWYLVATRNGLPLARGCLCRSEHDALEAAAVWMEAHPDSTDDLAVVFQTDPREKLRAPFQVHREPR